MPPSPVSRPPRPLFVSLILAVSVGVAGLAWWQQGRTPGAEEVIAFLDRTVGGERVRFSTAKLNVLDQDENGFKIAVVMRASAPGALYAQIDAAEYLREKFRLDAATAEEAQSVLSPQGSFPQPKAQGGAPFPADPFQAVILRLITPAGTSFAYTGIITARRDRGNWIFSFVTGGFEGAAPQGEARTSFGKTIYVTGEAVDDARLQGLVTDFVAFAGRQAGIRKDLAAARTAASEARRQAFLAQIAPGRVFRGLAKEAGTQHETPLSLEFTGLSPGNEVTAVLRNDNSWHVTRTFQGTWSADEKFAAPVLNLSSRPNQAARSAGPFLDYTQVWRFALQRDAKGELTEQNRFFQYRFQPVTAEEAVALQTRIEGEFDRAVAATKPGTLYLGTAVTRTTGASEPLCLRFIPRAPGNDALEVSLESTVRGWKRPLRGNILANARLSGGAPIRLQTNPADAVEEAPVGSALGDPGVLNLSLGAEQGLLVGGDERFTYRFAVAGAADLARLDADRHERERRLTGVMDNGIVYDGVMRTDHGYVFRTRLEFTRVDRPSGEITVRIRSLNRLKVFREFRGTWEPTGDAIVLHAADSGFLDTNSGFNIPFFISKKSTTLHLALTGNTLLGRLVGEPRWTMEFPLDVFLSAPIQSSAMAASFADDGTMVPILPKTDGAYLLSNGSWVSLPTNHGRIVSEPVPAMSDDEEAALGLRELKGGGGDAAPKKNSKQKGKEKEMVAYLDFDGKEPRPVAHGPALILLYVGPVPAGNPALELARTRIMDDGRRRLKIVGSSPTTIQLGDQRSAAYVRPLAANSILLTTTSKPAPGAYVVNAGVGYELTVE